MWKISIIIPTYNSSRYITDAVISILQQTYKNLEIIIIDDGSRDNTKDILSPYFEKSNVQYIYQKNLGPSSARNTGIKAAKGEFIAFLDSDDVLLPESLAQRIFFMEKYTDVSFVFGDFYVENPKAHIIDTPFLRGKNMLSKVLSAIERQDDAYYIFNSLYKEIAIRENLFPSTCSVMIKRRCFEEVGYFDLSLRAGEDTKMWLKLISKYRVGYIDEPQFIYKRYRSTLSCDTERYCTDYIKYFTEMLNEEFCNDNTKGAKIKQKICEHYFMLGYYFLQNRLTKKARINFIKSLKYKPMFFKSCFYLLISLLPLKTFDLFKRIKNKLFIC